MLDQIMYHDSQSCCKYVGNMHFICFQRDRVILLLSLRVLARVSLRNPVPTAKRSMAWLGTHDLEDKSDAYLGITYFIRHPRYQRWNDGYRHDIALVRLKRKVDFNKNVQPVKLPGSTDTFGPTSECFITGWGNVDRGGTSEQLQIDR